MIEKCLNLNEEGEKMIDKEIPEKGAEAPASSIPGSSNNAVPSDVKNKPDNISSALDSATKMVQSAADSKFFATKMRGIIKNKDVKPAADRADNTAIPRKDIKNKQD